MLKSILTMFGSLGLLILRFMLAIGLVFLFGYCIFTMMKMPFLWGGLLRLAGALLSAAAFTWLVGAFRRPDEDGGGADERRE